MSVSDTRATCDPRRFHCSHARESPLRRDAAACGRAPVQAPPYPCLRRGSVAPGTGTPRALVWAPTEVATGGDRSAQATTPLGSTAPQRPALRLASEPHAHGMASVVVHPAPLPVPAGKEASSHGKGGLSISRPGTLHHRFVAWLDRGGKYLVVLVWVAILVVGLVGVVRVFPSLKLSVCPRSVPLPPHWRCACFPPHTQRR